jgi:hypothetical protein
MVVNARVAGIGHLPQETDGDYGSVTTVKSWIWAARRSVSGAMLLAETRHPIAGVFAAGAC